MDSGRVEVFLEKYREEPPKHIVALEQEALDVLGKVKEYSPESWGRLRPSPEGARQAARLIDAFVRYHLGLEWGNGRFRSI